LPRSRLIAKALEEFIQRHHRELVREKLDEVYSAVPESLLETVSDSGLESMRSLTRDDAW